MREVNNLLLLFVSRENTVEPSQEEPSSRAMTTTTTCWNDDSSHGPYVRYRKFDLVNETKIGVTNVTETHD